MVLCDRIDHTTNRLLIFQFYMIRYMGILTPLSKQLTKAALKAELGSTWAMKSIHSIKPTLFKRVQENRLIVPTIY